jgi:hypothetical protein
VGNGGIWCSRLDPRGDEAERVDDFAEPGLWWAGTG